MSVQALLARGPADGAVGYLTPDDDQPPDAIYAVVSARHVTVLTADQADTIMVPSERYEWNTVHFCQVAGCARNGAHTYVWAPA